MPKNKFIRVRTSTEKFKELEKEVQRLGFPTISAFVRHRIFGDRTSREQTIANIIQEISDDRWRTHDHKSSITII